MSQPFLNTSVQYYNISWGPSLKLSGRIEIYEFAWSTLACILTKHSTYGIIKLPILPISQPQGHEFLSSEILKEELLQVPECVKRNILTSQKCKSEIERSLATEY